MADGPSLPARTTDAKTPPSSSTKPQVSRKMLLQPKGQQNFHCGLGDPHFLGQLASMNFIAAMRNPNCRRLLASCLRMLLRIVPERTSKRVHFRVKFYMKVDKSQFEEK